MNNQNFWDFFILSQSLILILYYSLYRDEEIPRMRYEANSGTAVFLLADLFSDIISPQLFIFSPILFVLVLMGSLQSHLQLLTENSQKNSESGWRRQEWQQGQF